MTPVGVRFRQISKCSDPLSSLSADRDIGRRDGAPAAASVSTRPVAVGCDRHLGDCFAAVAAGRRRSFNAR